MLHIYIYIYIYIYDIISLRVNGYWALVHFYWKGNPRSLRREVLPSDPLPTTNPTWTELVLNPIFRCEKPVANRLIQCTAILLFKFFHRTFSSLILFHFLHFLTHFHLFSSLLSLSFLVHGFLSYFYSFWSALWIVVTQIKYELINRVCVLWRDEK